MTILTLATLLSGCRFLGRAEPTRTPIPTFTPTPILVVVPAGAVPTSPASQQTAGISEAVPQAVQEPPTATPEPPTRTPTPPPTETRTPTPEATSTPTLTPSPTAPPDYQFELETAQKFPTESLAPGVVRVFLYVYAPGTLGLSDYGLRIVHNGAPLSSEALSKGGLPDVTRPDPGPYSRFTNLNVIVVEAPAGEWLVQLVDAEKQPVGPPATFNLTSNEDTRELYVRYRQITQ